MNLFKQQPTFITVLNNDELFFVELNPEKQYKILESIPLNLFLGDTISMKNAKDAYQLAGNLRDKENKLLIIPSYWISNTSYPFQSSKASLIETFIERKLHSEHPNLPDLPKFFKYNAYQSEKEGKMLHVSYYQDPSFFKLYYKLSELGLTPHKITSGPFLCEHEIKNKISDFNNGGKGIIHFSEQSCYLFFYSQGNFLFERDILLPDQESAPEERARTLTYEINQSLYLFSQKTKSDLNEFYFMSSSKEDISATTEAIGVNINNMSDLMLEQEHVDRDLAQSLGSLPFFKFKDFHTSTQLPHIPHLKRTREMMWKPVQRAGLAIGIFLLCLIFIEGAYIWNRTNQLNNRVKKSRAMESNEKIEQYNEAIDLLLQDSKRKSPAQIISGIINSLPDQYQPKEIYLDLEQNPSFTFSSTVLIDDIDSFRSSLSDFVSKTNKHLPLKKEMGIQDIEFKKDSTSNNLNENYSIQVKAEFK